MDIKEYLYTVSHSLNLTISEYCDHINSKEKTRYLHANVYSSENHQNQWRLKIVNQCHDDFQNIKECNIYNNCVHLILHESQCLQSIMGVPKYLAIPEINLATVNCSELIDGLNPTDDDICLIVNTLIQLQLNRINISNALFRPRNNSSCEINKYNKDNYKARLVSSLCGLLSNDRISFKEKNDIINLYEKLFPDPLQDNELTFVHGDFSYGNMKIQNNIIFIIDFEHSHIGCGLIDLAHLFVNMKSSGKNDLAKKLLNSYKELAKDKSIIFNENIFRALVLERVTGKMNSMKGEPNEKMARLSDLLFVKEL